MASTLLRKIVSKLQAGERSLPSLAFARVPAGATSADESAAPAQSAKALLEAGDFTAAIAIVDRALEAEPANADLLFARASVLFAWGRHNETYALLLALEAAGSRGADVYVKLGWTCFWLGRIEEADVWMRKAVALGPGDWTPHFGWATTQRALKHTAAAKAAFERALALRPDEPHCISNLVACEVELDHLDSAERYARAALARDPQSSSAHIDLGIVLCSQARYADAVAAFERADALEFSSIDARDESVNYAICLLRAGRPQQAMAMMESKLRLYPSGALHYHYALALLTAGRMREGWEHYEFRWLQEPLRSWRPAFLKPVWRGEDLQDKTILLRSEQGFGDFIQFARYAPSVKALGAKVLLQVRDELVALAAEITGIDRVLGSGVPYPDFDCYVNLLSLPRIFGTDVASIPACVPYLRVPADRTAAWEDTIPRDTKLNVGLVWAGSPTHLGDRFRSLSLRMLAPLRDIAGVRFFSLQKGPAAAELVTDTGREPLVDVGAKLVTFADTAAAIDRLDLVIGVDTAVMHLAGALAKPVWTLVAIPGDWRWLEAREDSPWYPSMRLFRQGEPGDWDEVVRRVKTALEGEVEQFRRGAARAGKGPVASHVILRPTAHPTPNAGADLCRIAETRHGILMYVPGDSTARSIESYGEHLQLELERFARLLKPGMTVMEVGAGIGAHAVPIASMLGPNGHLFLYEAQPFVRQVLQENLKANRVANATLMRRTLAVGDGAYLSQRPAGRATELSDAGGAHHSETIDELHLERLDWLKIDRGADAEAVLRGAEATAWRLRPRMFITVDEAAIGSATKSVRDLGYACWRVESALFNPDNFNRVPDDLFDGRMSVALIAVPEEADLAISLPGGTALA